MKLAQLYNVAIFAFCCIICSCSTSPVIQDKLIDSGEGLKLNEVSGTHFKHFLINKNINLAGYTGIIIAPLKLDQLTIDERRLQQRDKGWTLSDDEKARIANMFQQQAEKTLAENTATSPIRLAHQAAAGVASLEFEFIDYAPTASKDDGNNRGIGDRVFTRGIGSLSIKATVRDSLSQEIIAQLTDIREVGERVDMERNDRVNNYRYLRLEISAWLNKLRSTLGQLQ